MESSAQFPTLEQLQEYFLDLLSLDLKTCTIYEIQDKIVPIVKGFLIQNTILKSNTYINRAVQYNDKPENISFFAHPPINIINKYGRANNIGQSLFYGAVEKAVPFTEINAKVGDKFVVGLWKTVQDVRISHIGFTGEVKERLGSTRDLDAVHDFVIKTKSLGDLNSLVYEFLANQFTAHVSEEQNHLYKMSVVIANMLMSSEDVQGITYPSIATSGNSDNIVLVPEFVVKGLALVSMEYIEITKIDGYKITSKVIDTATEFDLSEAERGKILWSGRFLSLPGDIASFTSLVNNELLSRDSGGNRIEPICSGPLISSYTPFRESFEEPEVGFYKKTNYYSFSSTTIRNECGIELITRVNYNLYGKEKSISYFIPYLENIDDFCNWLFDEHAKELTRDGEYERVIEDRDDSSIVYSSKDCVFNNIISIYSENGFNTIPLILSFPKYRFQFFFDGSMPIGTRNKT